MGTIRDLWDGKVSSEVGELTMQLREATQGASSGDVCSRCNFAYRDGSTPLCPRCGACRGCEGQE